MTAEQREFDIVLYGATGFVGKLTAEYLARAGGDARIALAGRSPERLVAIRDTLGESAQSWPVLTADAASPSSLDDMAARTRVVITTVGPYSRYGLPLVAACAAAGTDYADLTGEAMFVRQSIDDYHKQAADTGARIVHACGFDSIPSDMSVFALHRRAEQDGTGELGDTNFVLRGFSGGVSGGTAASMVEVFRASSGDPEIRRLQQDPYTLTQDRAAEPELGPQPDLPWRRGSEIAPELAGLWTTGFAMALYNTRIVRRSNATARLRLRPQVPVRGEHERRLVVRRPGHLRGRHRQRTTASSHSAAGSSGCCRAGWSSASLPKPGTGPSEEAREKGLLPGRDLHHHDRGVRYVATISQQGDPGYKATSVMLGESGLALALDRDELSDLHGVLTPAAAMGDALLARFPAAGHLAGNRPTRLTSLPSISAPGGHILD